MAGVTPDRCGTVQPATSRLTSWEKDQLESIRLLLKKAISIQGYFEKTNQTLRRGDGAGTQQDSAGPVATDWMKFREIMFDLYSVLDYTYFLLYCHFANEGRPDHFHENARKCNFPFKIQGVKTCLENQECPHDKRNDFKKEKTEFLFKGKIREGTHFYRDIIEFFLELQPKLHVATSGSIIKLEIPEGDVESLAILHYFRNCSTHRSLIRVEQKEVWIEFNQTSRVGRANLVPTEKKKLEDETYYYLDKPLKGYILQLPEGLGAKENS